MVNFDQWNGFKGRLWKEEINVRDFVQNNYKPYDGDESFLEGPTEATNKLWGRLQELQKEERAKGGVERYDSVWEGLKCIKESGYVFIHDGARPCISQKLINDCYEAVVEDGACIAAVPVKDTIKIADSEGYAAKTPDRNTLWQIQTPQVFEYDIIKSAYSSLYRSGRFNGVTDDAMVLERFGEHHIKLVYSDYRNIKITTPEDLNTAEMFIENIF